MLELLGNSAVEVDADTVASGDVEGSFGIGIDADARDLLVLFGIFAGVLVVLNIGLGQHAL